MEDGGPAGPAELRQVASGALTIISPPLGRAAERERPWRPQRSSFGVVRAPWPLLRLLRLGHECRPRIPGLDFSTARGWREGVRCDRPVPVPDQPAAMGRSGTREAQGEHLGRVPAWGKVAGTGEVDEREGRHVVTLPGRAVRWGAVRPWGPWRGGMLQETRTAMGAAAGSGALVLKPS